MKNEYILKNEDYILFTDSWHPTINPSSRLPIHHLRYNALFQNRKGILTEVPRRYGGSTLREMIFSRAGLEVRDINKPVEWFMWWKNCNDPQVLNYIEEIVKLGMSSSDSYALKAYQEFWNRYNGLCFEKPTFTVGEIVNRVNNDFLYEITGIVAPELISYTKHNNYEMLIDSYSRIKSDIFSILDKLLDLRKRELLGMIGIITEYKNRSWNIKYAKGKEYFTVVNVLNPNDKIRMTKDMVYSLFLDKKILPGLVLSCVLECIVACQKTAIFHYGNSYGCFELLESIMNFSEDERRIIGYLGDNEDSWNYAELIKNDGTTYPIHILDSLNRNEIHEKIRGLIKESCDRQRTILIPIGEGDTFESALLNRRA
jgi:hypothetical protein